jgi:Tfp pilus assembly protein PilF
MKIRSFVVVLSGLILALLLASCGGADKSNESSGIDSVLNPLDEISKRIEANPEIDSLYKIRAEIYLEMNQPDKALGDMRKAIELNPQVTDYHILLGDIYLSMGNIESSKKSLIKAFEMDPGNPEPSTKLAELYLFLEDYEKVYLYCNQAIEIDKYNAPGYFIKGFALLEQDDTAKAIFNLQQATQNDPEYYDAFVMLGHIFLVKGDPIAGNYLKTAVRIRPSSIEARYHYGMWLQEQEMIEDALIQYDAILQIDPRNKNAWYNIGYINLVYLQNFKTAVEKFSKAIEYDPQYAEAWYNRGLAYEQLGEFDKARSDYKKALQIIDNYDKAIEGLNRIDGK